MFCLVSQTIAHIPQTLIICGIRDCSGRTPAPVPGPCLDGWVAGRECSVAVRRGAGRRAAPRHSPVSRQSDSDTAVGYGQLVAKGQIAAGNQSDNQPTSPTTSRPSSQPGSATPCSNSSNSHQTKVTQYDHREEISVLYLPPSSFSQRRVASSCLCN